MLDHLSGGRGAEPGTPSWHQRHAHGLDGSKLRQILCSSTKRQNSGEYQGDDHGVLGALKWIQMVLGSKNHGAFHAIHGFLRRRDEASGSGAATTGGPMGGKLVAAVKDKGTDSVCECLSGGVITRLTLRSSHLSCQKSTRTKTEGLEWCHKKRHDCGVHFDVGNVR